MSVITLTRDLLQALATAEDSGTPITFSDANKRWGRGSTWEDVVDDGHIDRWNERGVLVTKRGRQWLEDHKLPPS